MAGFTIYYLFITILFILFKYLASAACRVLRHNNYPLTGGIFLSITPSNELEVIKLVNTCSLDVFLAILSLIHNQYNFRYEWIKDLARGYPMNELLQQVDNLIDNWFLPQSFVFAKQIKFR